MSHTTSRATCRSNRTRDVGEVVDDGPARGEVVDDESRDKPRDMPSNRTRNVGEVVDDEPLDELHDVPRHPDARRRRSSQ
jgi:hypothetical protein